MYLKYCVSSIYWDNINGNGPNLPIYNIRFWAVYLLAFFQMKRFHAEFFICYVTFNSLQNGKKIFKKKLFA